MAQKQNLAQKFAPSPERMQLLDTGCGVQKREQNYTFGDPPPYANMFITKHTRNPPGNASPNPVRTFTLPSSAA